MRLWSLDIKSRKSNSLSNKLTQAYCLSDLLWTKLVIWTMDISWDELSLCVWISLFYSSRILFQLLVCCIVYGFSLFPFSFLWILWSELNFHNLHHNSLSTFCFYSIWQITSTNKEYFIYGLYLWEIEKF